MFYHAKTTVSEAHGTTFSYFLCSNDRPKSSKLLRFAPKRLLGRSSVFCFGSQKTKNRGCKAQQPIPKTQGPHFGVVLGYFWALGMSLGDFGRCLASTWPSWVQLGRLPWNPPPLYLEEKDVKEKKLMRRQSK